MTLPLEHYLPRWEFAERNSRLLEGMPKELYQKLLVADFSKSWLLKVLFGLRGLKIGPFSNIRKRFSTLSEEPLILGLIAKPWQFDPQIVSQPANEFVHFNEPGFIKAVWNFEFEPQGDGKTLVSTETRIHCTDPAAYRKFRIYWFFVRPFSNLVRREMLRIIQ